jgi:hypothetical protein
MDTDVTKYLLLYLCMALAISFFFPQTVLGDSESNILGIFKIGVNSTTNEVYIQDVGFANDRINTLTTNNEVDEGFFQKGINVVTTFFQYIADGLGNVLGVIKILFAFIFSPFIFVLDPQLLGEAPSFVKLIFALPLVFLTFMGIIKLIRGIN